jgi:hypothetical protein
MSANVGGVVRTADSAETNCSHFLLLAICSFGASCCSGCHFAGRTDVFRWASASWALLCRLILSFELLSLPESSSLLRMSLMVRLLMLVESNLLPMLKRQLQLTLPILLWQYSCAS